MLDIVSVSSDMECDIHHKPAVAKVSVHDVTAHICIMCLGKFNKQVSNVLSHIIDWKEQA